jgi:hypothetical protein
MGIVLQGDELDHLRKADLFIEDIGQDLVLVKGVLFGSKLIEKMILIVRAMSGLPIQDLGDLDEALDDKVILGISSIKTIDQSNKVEERFHTIGRDDGDVVTLELFPE